MPLFWFPWDREGVRVRRVLCLGFCLEVAFALGWALALFVLMLLLVVGGGGLLVCFCRDFVVRGRGGSRDLAFLAVVVRGRFGLCLLGRKRESSSGEDEGESEGMSNCRLSQAAARFVLRRFVGLRIWSCDVRMGKGCWVTKGGLVEEEVLDLAGEAEELLLRGGAMMSESSSLGVGRCFWPDLRRDERGCGGSAGSGEGSAGSGLVSELAWPFDPTGSKELSLRFLEVELDSRDVAGLVGVGFDLAWLSGVDSSSGRVKLSDRLKLDSSTSGGCKILCCRLLGLMPSNTEFSFEGVGCVDEGRTADDGARGNAGAGCSLSTGTDVREVDVAGG